MRNIDGGCTLSPWSLPILDDALAVLAHQTDVCIVGAGIAGITCAYELARRGVRVTVLDDGPIGGGETGRTTAHLASAVDDRFAILEDRFDEDTARMVAESHAAAIDYIEMTARDLGIDCDFERVDGYLFAPPDEPSESHLKLLARELVAAERAGLAVTRVDHVPMMPVPGPALRFARQAQFHPMKYLAGLARAARELGAHIHTGVRVRSITPGEPLVMNLADDRTLLCRVAIDCTNGAMTSPTKLTIRQAAYQTYVVGFAIPPNSVPRALYWDTANPYHYIRVVPGTDHDVLLVGGNDHRTGHGGEVQAFADLDLWTRTHFPFVTRMVHRWSGQVREPADDLAFIGKSPDLDHVYVATGDSGNGLTHGTLAGLIIPELMHGFTPRWATIYDPRRTKLHGLGRLVREAAGSTAPYFDWLRGGEVRSLEQIPRGQGAIIRDGLHLVAAYCDDEGHHHLRSATCPHLRGAVHWNAIERTWDCPCHGSRFDPYGRMLAGPACSDLAPLEAPVPVEDRITDRIAVPMLHLERD